ncbi:hypothetical protein OB13_13120 [Pontibacter sp. HJ8]
MRNPEQEVEGRARESSTEGVNQHADQSIRKSISRYRLKGSDAISERIRELDQEWSIERTLQVNGATLALTGTLLGAFVNKRWLVVPGLVATFLLQHGMQGWCPPVTVMRALGIRWRREIEEERSSLKVIRGDFKEVTSSSTPAEVLQTIRKT